MKVNRYEENPLIAPADVAPYHEGFEVIGAFNAGVAVHEGETLLLLRVAERPLPREEGTVGAPMIDPVSGKVEVKELRLDDPRYDFSDPRTIRERGSEGALAYLTSLSYIRIARSRDGRHFTVDDRPFIYPSGTLETFGIEDPRVTRIDDTYYIYFSAVSPAGIGESLVSTTDFVHAEHHGMIFGPDNKDVIIFPEKVGGKYYALHRPTTPSTGRPEIWLAESDNLLYWGNHKHLLGLRPEHWDSGRIGGGAVPIRTDQGWLALYHGATREHRYCMGAVLLDADDPSCVLARSARPILEPEAPYETDGFFGGVVFACGAAVDGDTVRLYYGAADTSTACAELSLNEIMEGLEPV